MIMGRVLLLMLASFCLAGCLYSNTTKPLMTDFESTDAGGKVSSGDVKKVSFYVSVEWDENGIGEIAKANGINEIYYADIEERRIFTYWKRRKVHVYGY